MTSIEECKAHEEFLDAGASEVLLFGKEVGFAETLAAVRKLGTRSSRLLLTGSPLR